MEAMSLSLGNRRFSWGLQGRDSEGEEVTRDGGGKTGTESVEEANDAWWWVYSV